MDFEVARRELERRLRLVHGFVELAAREQRPRDAVEAARQPRRERQGVPIPKLGFLEQARGPEGIAVQRDGIGVARGGLGQGFALVPRRVELRHTQRRLNDARPRPAQQERVLRLQGVLKGLERLDVPSF